LRKLILSTLCAGLFLLACATVALANAGPHGNYAYSTDGCATCHSTHNSSYDKLMKFGYSPTEVCYQCHNGSGASTNVEHGMINTFNGAPGGAFELNVPAESKTVTSAHLVGSTWPTVPGGYTVDINNNQVDLTNFNFQCSSCHNPHGSPNARLIKDNINGFAVAFQETITTGVAYTDPNTSTTKYDGVSVTYTTGSSSLCNACHGKYNNNGPTTQTTDPVTGTTQYIHRIDFDPAAGRPEVPYNPAGTTSGPYIAGYTTELPLQTNAPSGPSWMTCMTCHFAHGSKVTAPDASVFQTTAGTNPPTPHPSSSLLRSPGRQVCSQCHEQNTYY
jgi:predicted CXXCH cytochrome family protein